MLASPNLKTRIIAAAIGNIFENSVKHVLDALNIQKELTRYYIQRKIVFFTESGTIVCKVILKEGWGFIGGHRVNHRYII